MRRRFVQLPGGDLVEVGQDYDPEPREPVHHVMGDIEPFRANTGEVISGRAQWRAHLRATGCEEFSPAEIRAMAAKGCRPAPKKDPRRVEQLVAAWDKVRPKRT